MIFACHLLFKKLLAHWYVMYGDIFITLPLVWPHVSPGAVNKWESV